MPLASLGLAPNSDAPIASPADSALVAAFVDLAHALSSLGVLRKRFGIYPKPSVARSTVSGSKNSPNSAKATCLSLRPSIIPHLAVYKFLSPRPILPSTALSTDSIALPKTVSP